VTRDTSGIDPSELERHAQARPCIIQHQETHVIAFCHGIDGTSVAVRMSLAAQKGALLDEKSIWNVLSISIEGIIEATHNPNCEMTLTASNRSQEKQEPGFRFHKLLHFRQVLPFFLICRRPILQAARE